MEKVVENCVRIITGKVWKVMEGCGKCDKTSKASNKKCMFKRFCKIKLVNFL